MKIREIRGKKEIYSYSEIGKTNFADFARKFLTTEFAEVTELKEKICAITLICEIDV